MEGIIEPVSRPFELVSDYAPAGDQPKAIAQLVGNFREGISDQVMLGVTGSGKTFAMANVIAQLGLPTLVLSHNKTLAGQLYQEFRGFFPHNAVEYFVSYYDYYQPEAYLPTTDTYIEKDAAVNEEIDKLRLRATTSLLTRKDIVVVATVSCIYGLGSPIEYFRKAIQIRPGDSMERDDLLRQLVDMQYVRNDFQMKRGHFRVRGDVVEVQPAYEERTLRIEFLGDTIERLRWVDPLTGNLIDEPPAAAVFPARHFQTEDTTLSEAIADMRAELDSQLQLFSREGKLVEYERLKSRTLYDIEMLTETGYCSGVENYSRILERRAPGTPPNTLFDFFRKPFLLIIDESHVTVPQLGGMFAGDHSRKTQLVNYGFRLPCALDNRPLNFQEFEARMPQTLFVSATPAPYELNRAGGEVAELVVRPTGLLDPEIEVRPITGQIDDLMEEIRKRREHGERTLVTTLTKRMAEDLTDYLAQNGVPVRWLHSEVDTFERAELIRGLREGEFDVLVGINLLREGLDLPEVSLVAILDADKEGFLRSTTSLIQTAGRASRNVNGKVIFYADNMTDSMRACIEETSRRRALQQQFNAEHGITPTTVARKIHDKLGPSEEFDELEEKAAKKKKRSGGRKLRHSQPAIRSGNAKTVLPAPAVEGPDAPVWDDVEALHARMMEAAAELDFERAAKLRDRLRELGA